MSRLWVALDAPRLRAYSTFSVNEVKVNVGRDGEADGSAKKAAIGLGFGKYEQENSGFTKR